MGNNCRTNTLFPILLTLTLFLVFTMTPAHPVQNKNTLLTKVKQRRPEVEKKDGVVGTHRVSRRFARPDTSGVFLNHFPVTNLRSTPNKIRRTDTNQGPNSVLDKPVSRTSAFRNTQRVIYSNPSPTDLMKDQSLRQRGKDSSPNVVFKNSLARKPLDRQVPRNKENRDKVQAWKDLSDKLMSSWSDVGSETTTSGGETYTPRTSSFTITTESVNKPGLHGIEYLAYENHQTAPVLRESIQHGPPIIRTRIPNSRQTMIGYAESFTTPSSNDNDKLNGGYFTEPGVLSTSRPSTTPTVYPITRPIITTDPIDRIVTPSTRRHFGEGYDVVPNQYEESVYHRPSQVHTRTLVKGSWKTIERGLPNASIAVSDSEYSDYAVSNSTSEPVGYAIPVSHWRDTHGTRASEHAYDQETHINNITDNFPDPLNSTIGHLAIGDRYDSSTVETRFVETKPNQENILSLPSGTSEQNVNSDIYFTSTNENSFSKSTPKEDRTFGPVGGASKLAATINLSPVSTVGYHTITSTPNYEQMTSATGGNLIATTSQDKEQSTSATGETSSHHSASIETTRRGESSHTTPVYTAVENEGIPSIINIKVDPIRAPNQSVATTVSKSQTRTTSTPAPMAFTKPLVPKREPAKMKVYDIKEILQGELEKKTQARKGGKQHIRKTTPMKVYDITEPVINKINAKPPNVKGVTLDPKNNQNSPSKQDFGSNTKSSKANEEQHLMRDILKDLSNSTNNNTDRKKTTLTRNNQPAAFTQGDMLEAQGRTELTKSKNREKDVKSIKYHGKRFVINGTVVTNKSVGNGQEMMERKATAKWDEINTQDTETNNDVWSSNQQQQTVDKYSSVDDNQSRNVVTNTNKTQHNGTDVIVHHQNSSACNDSDTHHITRAISVIKKLIDKIQAKPVVKALPKPHRQRYLLIPLGNLTFTEIKQKLLAYQTYMHEFRNNRWSDNSLAHDLNTGTGTGSTPIVLDHRPIQR